jgi:flagellar assembly protein FliH
VPEPAVILLPAPLLTVEVTAAPANLAAPTGARPAAVSPAKAQEALAEAQARLEEERGHLAETRAALEKALDGLRVAEREVLAGAEAQVLELALAIAGKVLMQEIEAGRFQMEPVVREALRHAPSRRDVVVHLSPPDAAAWQPGAAVSATGLKIVADAALNRGDCLVETAEAAVLTTVPERLEAVAKTLRQANPA